jgi:hypothetical protein
MSKIFQPLQHEAKFGKDLSCGIGILKLMTENQM